MAILDVLNANNELFRIYVTWCGVLIIKTLMMAALTVYHRRKNKVANELCKQTSNLFLWPFSGDDFTGRLQSWQRFWSENSRRRWTMSSGAFEWSRKHFTISDHWNFLHSDWTKRCRHLLAVQNCWCCENRTFNRLRHLPSSTTNASSSTLHWVRHFTLHDDVFCRLLLQILNWSWNEKFQENLKKALTITYSKTIKEDSGINVEHLKK